jgi:hypothetical protein
VVERAAFLGEPGERIFMVQHLPPDPIASVLICSSIKIEFHANYGREVRLARELASRGIAVGRFHYRGAGNSDGDELAFSSMVEDASTAAIALEKASGANLGALTGTRFGAITAMAFGAQIGGLPLALWQPVLDPKTYMREILKKGRLATMGREETEPKKPPGELDVLGYTYPAQVFQDASIAIAKEPLDRSPKCLIVEMTLRGAPSGRFEAITDRFERSGREAAIATTKGFPQLWFLGPRRENHDPDVSTSVVSWLEEIFGDGT